jgi:hypothetical protein
MRAYAVPLVIVLGLACLSGCGGATMAPVKGRVMCDGKPVANASVTFNPVPGDDKDITPGKPGTGYSDAEGYFVLSTYKPADGALVGQHRVRVWVDDTNPAKCKRNTVVVKEVKAENNVIDIELFP